MLRYADLTNDVAFRRVFGRSPALLAALLEDLLGEPRIGAVEPLSPEHAPEIAGASLPVASVRCRDSKRTTFIVEVQILQVPGFLERAMHEACRTFVEQPRRGGAFQELGSVVAVSICGFELWPDRDQDARRAPRVPMLSRWRMEEQDSGAGGAGLLQHVVLEIPKLHGRLPETGAEQWAWLFRHAADLTEVPAHLPSGPHRRALELCDLATFTAADLEAYRRARDAIEQTREAVRVAEARGRREGLSSGRREGVVQGKRDGLLEGEAKGRREALREALFTWLEARGIEMSPSERARLEGEGRIDALSRWVQRAPHAETAAEILREPSSASITLTPPPPSTRLEPLSTRLPPVDD
ncbi:MAG: PD-(D/E)XK nuclease family transposase [Minicystis sp.]